MLVTFFQVLEVDLRFRFIKGIDDVHLPSFFYLLAYGARYILSDGCQTDEMVIGFRPGGSSSRQKHPDRHTTSSPMYGIGVAVITSTWGGCIFFVQRRARCATPKRCCSSITTSPKEEKFTVSSMTACVPYQIFTSPVSSPVRSLPSSFL